MYWEMCETAGEAMETLYIFQHPHLSLMRKKSKYSLTAWLFCLLCTALEQQKTDNRVNFRHICSTCTLLHVTCYITC